MMIKLTQRMFSSMAFWVVGALVLAAIASNLTAGDSTPQRPKQAAAAGEEKLLREGTRIVGDIGECRTDGDRLSIIFGEQPTRSLIALENLAAQRIVQAVLDDPSDRSWKVSGTITEFQGRNYILLERVARSAK